MDRRPHALKHNRTTEAPKYFLLLDTETLPERIDDDTERHHFRLGVAAFWRRERDNEPEAITWHDLHSIEALWVLIDRLCPARQRLCIVAHNMGFDLQVVGGPNAIDSHGWKIGKAIVDDPPFILKARNGDRSLLFLDWYNYFRGSLAYAGELLGTPKMRMPDFGSSQEEWFAYCRNDVLVLLEAVRRYVAFIIETDLGAFAFTLAGQAINAYRHRFMDFPIFIHCDKKAISIERAGYYGGRVEMFHRGQLPAGEYAYVDVNSMFPAVMRSEEYPTALKAVLRNPSIERVKELCQTSCVVASVEVECEQPLYPVRQEQRLLFPIGRYSTTLPTAELRLALDRGDVKCVSECVIYSRAPIFRTWVDELYNLRAQAKASGDALWDELLKRMMNSLYGKFGQANDEWTFIRDEEGEQDRIWTEYNAADQSMNTYRRLGGQVEVMSGKEEGYNSFVAIAAHVTSSARVLLLKYIEAAGWANVFYCDTDSLMVNAAGLQRLQPYLDQSRLGYLKVEATSSNVHLYAPKNYRFGDMTKHKGRRSDAEALQDGRYRQIQFMSLVGALRQGEVNGPIIKRIVKRDALQYNKGIVADDGAIHPLRLGT